LAVVQPYGEEWSLPRFDRLVCEVPDEVAALEYIVQL